MTHKTAICLWFDNGAEEAARFYTDTFPDSAMGEIHYAPGDYPAGQTGAVLTVDFTVCGIPYVGLNGGPYATPNEAYSTQVFTETQEETDRLWSTILGNGGSEMQCGWCKDKWGFAWQIIPRQLSAALSNSDPAAAKRAFDAMMEMVKIDIAAIEAAVAG